MANFRSRPTKSVKNKRSKVNTLVLAGLKMFMVLELLSCAQSCKILKRVLGSGCHEKLRLQGRGDHDIERLATVTRPHREEDITRDCAAGIQPDLFSRGQRSFHSETKEDIPEPIVFGNPLTGTGADNGMVAPGV